MKTVWVVYEYASTLETGMDSLVMQALNLDASTIMVANIMIGFCLTILLSFSLLDHITCPGMRFWSLSFLAWTIGLVCMLSRMYIPLWISVCLGISLIVTGYSPQRSPHFLILK